MVLHSPTAGMTAPAAEAVEVETPEVAAGGAGMGMPGYGAAGSWGPYGAPMPPPGYRVIYVPVQSYGPLGRRYPGSIGADRGLHAQAPPGVGARPSRPPGGAGPAGADVGYGRDASGSGIGRGPSRTATGRRASGVGVGSGSTRSRASGGSPHYGGGGGSPPYGASDRRYPHPPGVGAYHYPPSAGAYHYPPSGGAYPYHGNSGGYPFAGVPGRPYGGGAAMVMDPVVQQLLDIEPAGTGAANTAQQPTEVEQELGAGTGAGLGAFSYGVPSQGMWVPGPGVNRGGATTGGWI